MNSYDLIWILIQELLKSKENDLDEKETEDQK